MGENTKRLELCLKADSEEAVLLFAVFRLCERPTLYSLQMEAANILISGLFPLKCGFEVNGCGDIRMTEDTCLMKMISLGNFTPTMANTTVSHRS